VAPDDPSVMLLDCARMGSVWTLEAAQGGPKRALQQRALAAPGLWGPLDPRWNARDGEYQPGRSKLLHFTNLHTQPWAPFPERFVYQRHPQGALWEALERGADAAGFQLFSRSAPSELFRALPADPPLEQVPGEDLPWVLDERLQGAAPVAHLSIRCDPQRGWQRGPDGRCEARRSADWWTAQLDAAGQRNPGQRWEAELRQEDAPPRLRVGGPAPDGSPPRVWVLLDDRPGNSTQSIGLADALGWPYELKQLRPGPLSALHNRLLGASRRGIDDRRSDPLEPPWPDLVVAAGRRTAPVALWIRERSAGRARLVQLGRKGGDHAALFDLVASPAYCRLFPHPHRVELHAPLHRVTPERLEEARGEWGERLDPHPRPRIVLVAGGTSGQYRMTPEAARSLAGFALGLARERGGSVLATTSRRTGVAATQALRVALEGVPGHFQAAGDPGDNPYLGYLAFADAVVTTADSESILAEASSLGCPVHIHPLPTRLSFRALRRLRDLVLERASASPSGPRGTGRPQRGLEYLCARLIERGYVRPARDLDRLHRDLVSRGVAQRVGRDDPPAAGSPLREAPEVAGRVRALLGHPAESRAPRGSGVPSLASL
jgi:mitochondrial fission protein ELM1